MKVGPLASSIRAWVASMAVGLASQAVAAPVRIEAVIAPKSESRLEFADGSKRFLLATQREGRASGNGPLAGTTLLEWGVHDVDPAAGANASGYLVFTAAEGDIAYLKYQFRAVPIAGPDGKPRFVANGFWETVGGTGKFKALRGAGTLRVLPASPKERQWLLDGDLATGE